ncbi:CatB-related O-acetyltransferase [Chryseobacterium sp. SSA4.19]|uniref:CatB-related O-acetyltransferase n=1 Tax=Chryseobacterium sp. SSA4.19 TaxID=2919915 RepID=UPI001F4E2C02|nr:CatB-related O-acetyltransferase [Chryseobacterium sp. SSA4.19]MCJ8152378.1 CatB-related O-acetyltransferase [Chryseobacterium sp. SSA4.19]
MFDRSFLQNPIFEYLRWLKTKIRYQSKYDYLRIGYMSKLVNANFGRYNMLARNVTVMNSSIGDFSYVSDGSVINETIIGKFCSIGPNVRTGPGKHPTHTFVTTHPSVYSNPSNLLKNFSAKDNYDYKKEITIGNDVWIGANALILNGVSIGDGAIIGANAVITSDVAPYSIMVGIPGKLVKYRFNEDEINFLLDFKWWNKGDEWIESNADSLFDIKNFIKLNSVLQ